MRPSGHLLSPTTPSGDSGLWPPPAWAATQCPATESPSERAAGPCHLGPEEGTCPHAAPGLPRAPLTMLRTPPLPLPGCLPGRGGGAWGCPTPAPGPPASSQTCRGLQHSRALPEPTRRPSPASAARSPVVAQPGRTVGIQTQLWLDLCSFSLCTCPLVTSPQAMPRSCLRAGLLRLLEAETN